MPDMQKRLNQSKLFIAVGIGGAIGAISRYSIAQFFADINGFPFATLTVNLLGSFFLCLILFQPKVIQRLKPWMFTGLTVGLIGSFTTFSAIILELYDLWHVNMGLAVIYLSITISGGLLCCFLRYKLAQS